jgi:class 3 adenylate cyclase/tetratricopeptide (TPR) repeat protein
MSTDLQKWLQRQGLAHLGAVLSEAGLDLDVLSDLTSAELAEIGLSLGDRKRLLKAVAAGLTSGGAEAGAAGPHPASDTPARHAARASHSPLAVQSSPSPWRLESERRQLTVMFCDLVGSTALAAGMDPEEFKAIIGEYYARVREAVAPYEGHVAKYLGDGVLVYFGYPVAHEDAAVRAVRAALAVVGLLQARVVGGVHAVQTRIGIATGLVVIGSGVGAGGSVEAEATGDVPNLAARLQAEAPPMGIVLAEQTRAQVGETFELEPTQPLLLKGLAQPVVGWRVLGERRLDSRFESLRGHVPRAFVGREGELDLLLRAWHTAREGEAQLAVITADAGLGKSRLCQALKERVGAEGGRVVTLQCAPHLAGSPLSPVARSLELHAGLEPGDDTGRRLAKLQGLLGQLQAQLTPRQQHALELLLCPQAPRTGFEQVTPGELRQEAMTGLTSLLASMAQATPLLVLVEDAHWIDPTTQAFLEEAVGELRLRPLQWVVTCRPQYQAAWADRAGATRLRLSRIARRACERLIESIAGAQLEPAVVQQILERTDGVPLFVEELTRALMGSTAERVGAGGKVAGAAAVPSTLQDSLMARLDQLSRAREVAQVAAVIGREFESDVLARVLEVEPGQLAVALGELVQADLIHAQPSSVAGGYQFKHALIRDVAYDSLLKSVRAVWHAKVAGALQTLRAQGVQTQPQLVAQHLEDAQRPQEAWDWWRKAAERAQAQGAASEAEALFARAIELNERLPRTEDLDAALVLMLAAMVVFLIYSQGPVSPVTQEVMSRAYNMAFKRRRASELIAVLTGAIALSNRSHFISSIQAMEEIAAEEVNCLPLKQQVDRLLILGILYKSVGRLSEAVNTFERGLSIDTSRPGPATGLGGSSAWITLRVHLAIALEACDQDANAAALRDEVWDAAQQLTHAPTVLWAGHAKARALIARGAWPKLEVLAREMLHRGTKFRYWIGMHRVNLACALVGQGKLGEGLREARIALDLHAQVSGQWLMAERCAQVCERLVEQACEAATLDEFLRLAEAALQKSEDQWAAPYVLRLRGRWHEMRGDLDAASAHYAQAVELAQSMQARKFARQAQEELDRLQSLGTRV